MFKMEIKLKFAFFEHASKQISKQIQMTCYAQTLGHLGFE